ncbi:MAG: Maf family protein [Henriciella sp.]
MTDLILASGSASRRALLAGAGVEATATKPNLDEDSLKASFRATGMSVRDQAMQLAELKALKISARMPGLVIGGDQMLSLGDRAFDKPKDMAQAAEHLRALSNQSHTLETAIAIAENGKVVWRHLSRPKLRMRQLSEGAISTYLSRVDDSILSTVGAYQLEGIGAQLFAQIDGDYFSILGLPLFPLLDYLRLRGVIGP